jgi:hypothetical protein
VFRRSRLLLICAAGLAGAATSLVAASPALAVPGLVVVTATSGAADSTDFKVANPVCPAGKVLLGGGADIVGGGHNVQLAGINPAALGAPANSIWATANESGAGYAGNWFLIGYAFCGTGVQGYEIVQASSNEPAGSTFASATATCPAGKKVIGTGAISAGKVGYVLDTMDVSADLTSVYVETIATEFASPDTAPLAVAYAVCINPVVGMQRVAASSPFNSSDKILRVSCPPGKSLHGVGGGMTGALGQAYMDMMAGSGATATIDAREDASGTTANWKVDIYGICAP